MSTRGGGRVPGRDDRGAVALGLPSVAIVGVPNVGKSTLFNRLVGRRQALVGHRPGVTRDRIHGEAQLGGRDVSLTDTGGIFAEAGEGMAELVRAQARLAVAEADAILLLVDGRRGLTPADRDLAALLRTSGRPTILAVNKVDHGDPEPFRAEYFGLGLGEPVAISAEHGVGINELVERLLEPLPEAAGEGTVRASVRAIAIVGRPNVGKSSLLNALGQEQRAIVSDVPGTTRDSIDLIFESEGRRYRIVDTAGIRRAARTPDPIDRLSTHRATASLQAADVALVVLDGADGITSRDQAVAGIAQRFLRPLVLLANKWDLAPAGEAAREEFRAGISRKFRFARFAPCLFISARTGAGLEAVLPTVEAVWENGATQIGASRLNRLLGRLNERQPGRTRSGRPLKSMYIAQTGIHPPAFTIFANSDEAPHFSYRRFLENRIRREFGLHLTPLALHWRRK